MTRRTDIMRREIRRQTLAAAPGLKNCIWSPFQGPRPERPYAEWRPITQPSARGWLTDNRTTIELPRQADVQVLSATVGQAYRIDFNYTAVTSTPESGATVTTVRDDLLAKINADRDPVTAAAVSTDVVRLTADSPGDLWRVITVSSRLLSTTTVGSAVDIVDLMTAPLTMTASLNIYSAGTAAEGGTELQDSSSFAHEVDVAFRKPRVTSEMSDLHLAVTRIAEPVNLDNVPPSQASFESRTAVDFMISLPYWESEFIEEISSTEITISIAEGQQTFTV